MQKNKLKIGLTTIVVFLLLILFNSHNLAKDLNLLKEKSFKVNSGQLLNVRTDVGDVIVKTWNKDEVLVKIYGDSDAERRMEFSFNQDENGILVIGEKEGGRLFSWFSNIELKFDIMVPMKFDLKIRSSGGDLVAKNIEGKSHLMTSGGDIYTKNFTGDFEAETSGGDISLFNLTGNAEVSTSGGDIEVSAENGNISANTSGGDIRMESSNGEVYAKTSGGDIFLNYSGVNMGINLLTSGGDIDVKLPSNIDADVEIKSSGGDLVNNFSQNRMSKVTKSQLIGQFNNGGNMIICKTSGGDISVIEK